MNTPPSETVAAEGATSDSIPSGKEAAAITDMNSLTSKKLTPDNVIAAQASADSEVSPSVTSTQVEPAAAAIIPPDVTPLISAATAPPSVSVSDDTPSVETKPAPVELKEGVSPAGPSPSFGDEDSTRFLSSEAQPLKLVKAAAAVSEETQPPETFSSEASDIPVEPILAADAPGGLQGFPPN